MMFAFYPPHFEVTKGTRAFSARHFIINTSDPLVPIALHLPGSFAIRGRVIFCRSLTSCVILGKEMRQAAAPGIRPS